MSKRNAAVRGSMLAATWLVLGARAAGAQDFSLQLRDGLVTLVAHDAPAPQILDRWARMGGTTIVNRENMKQTPLTLQLTEVPERTALAILLRDVGGYILAELVGAREGASAIDRIIILPSRVGAVRDSAPPAPVSVPIFVDTSEQPPPAVAPDIQVVREPDIEEPEPPGAAPTRR